MSSKPDLKIDWCTYAAAKYACENWHYSRKIPTGKLVKIGAWEGSGFVGAVVFGRGAGPQIGRPYSLKQNEICELVRIALIRGHQWPVSRITTIGLRLLKMENPGLRLIVSYADPEQGHYGGIYQAMGWIYTGTIKSEWTVNGLHCRNFGNSMVRVRAVLGANAKIEQHADKFKYLYPLDDSMRQQVSPMSKPYPKACEVGDGAFPAYSGGSTPTRTLQPQIRFNRRNARRKAKA